MRNGTIHDDSKRGGRSKRELFGWKAAGDRGQLMWLDKRLLNVDHAYQRVRTKENRVNEIARTWSWPACLPIGVFVRPDGRYYVYDGQHRVRAALKRDDVQELPCWVFEGEEVAEEADAFVKSNTVRGPVTAAEKFKAKLVANDEESRAISAILGDYGYEVGVGGNTRGMICCIAAVERAYQRSPERLRRVLAICQSVYDNKPPNNVVFQAMEYLDGHLASSEGASIYRADVKEKLLATDARELEKVCLSYQALSGGKGGAKVWAAGLVEHLNKGKRTRRIARPFGG